MTTHFNTWPNPLFGFRSQCALRYAIWIDATPIKMLTKHCRTDYTLILIDGSSANHSRPHLSFICNSVNAFNFGYEIFIRDQHSPTFRPVAYIFVRRPMHQPRVCDASSILIIQHAHAVYDSDAAVSAIRNSRPNKPEEMAIAGALNVLVQPRGAGIGS